MSLRYKCTICHAEEESQKHHDTECHGQGEYKKLTNWEDALVVKVVVSQEDILAWGTDCNIYALVVKCCRVIS